MMDIFRGKNKKSRLYREIIIVSSLILILLIFSIPNFIKSQNINTAQHFPDPNFRRGIEVKLNIKPGEPFSASQVAYILWFLTRICA